MTPFLLQPLPYLPVHINGRGPFQFLLDTGAVGYSLTPQLASELGLSVAPDHTTTLAALDLDAAHWSDIRVGVYDWSAVQNLTGHHLDGLLGNAFLRNQRLTLDFASQSFSAEILADPRDPLPTPPGQHPAHPAAVPIQIKNHYTIVPVGLNGRGPYQFLLDTGACMSVVAPHVADALGLVRGPACSARGVANTLAANEATLPLLTVGRLARHDLAIIIADCADASSNTGTPIDGYLGLDMFHGRSLTFRYREHAIGVGGL